MSIDPFHQTVLTRLTVISIVNPFKGFIYINIYIFLCMYISNAIICIIALEIYIHKKRYNLYYITFASNCIKLLYDIKATSKHRELQRGDGSACFRIALAVL